MAHPKSWFSLFVSRGGWLSLLSASVFVVLSALSILEFRAAATFERESLELDAEIVGLDAVWDDGTYRYVADIRYKPNASWFVVEKDISERFFTQNEPGDRVRIFYLPSNPREFSFSRRQSRVDAQFYSWVAGASGVVALVSFWISGLTSVQMLRARRYGRRVNAEITRIDVVSYKGRETTDRKVHWKEDNGRFGKSGAVSVQILDDLDVGDTIWVFHGPNASFWELEVGPRQMTNRSLPTVPARQPE